jgi:5'-nucleotidase
MFVMNGNQNNNEALGVERKANEKSREDQYLNLRKHYKKISLNILRAASAAAVLLFLLIITDKILNGIICGPSYFFLCISFIAFCISIALQLQYRSLLKDPLSDFSENTSLFTHGTSKTLEERIAKNRRVVFENSIVFWTGLFSFLLALILWLSSKNCESVADGSTSQSRKEDGKITVDILQINDVYEISALDSGRIGGMARIAALKKELRQQNENTLLLMAGDFLSPSVFNSVKVNGDKVAGKQMIDAMNAAEVDLAVFGNHEFDISYKVLQQRINESRFQWIASNLHYKTASGNISFQKNNTDIPASWKKTFTDGNGNAFTIGFFGLTLPDNKGNPEYVNYDSPLSAAKEMYAELAPGCDAVIALTHQELKDDSLLAAAIPQLTAIIGGHEHDMQFEKVGNVYISKAHSNAKSAFHLKLILSRTNNATTVSVIPKLLPVDTSVQEDYVTKIICDGWMNVAKLYFKNSGFSPDETICKNFTADLDGTDVQVRNTQTNLTRLITDAMLWASKADTCKIAVLNAGAIRADDVITAPITQYSLLRALPYEGSIYFARMKGSFIKKLLNAGKLLQNEGGFLQYSGLDINSWSIDKVPIDDVKSYKVAVADYLITGQQKKLEFVKEGTPGIDFIYPAPLAKDSSLYDLRKAVINYLRNSCRDKQALSQYN